MSNTVTGGRMSFSRLNKKAFTENEASYQALKAQIWLQMINDQQRPVKWFKPHAKGTNVDFVMIDSVNSYHFAMGELKGFIASMNERFPELQMTLEEGQNDSKSQQISNGVYQVYNA